MSDRDVLGGSQMPPGSFGGGSTGSPSSFDAGSLGGAMGREEQPWRTGGQPGQPGGQGDQGSQGGQGAGSPMDQARETATQAVDTAREKAGQVVEQASTKVDTGIDKAATGLDRAADMLREKTQGMGEQGGGVQAVATQAADRLDSAAQYLQGRDTDQLIADLEALVRRRPTESLLVAFGVGFLLSKALR